jgi:membrane protease YdiL (CAAX protease family)
MIALERRKYVYTGLGGLWISMLMFFIWGFTDSDWPWFLIIWLAAGIAFGVVFWKFRDEEPPVLVKKADDSALADQMSLVSTLLFACWESSTFVKQVSFRRRP